MGGDRDYLAATVLVSALALLRLATLVVVVVGMAGFFLRRWQGGLVALLPWLG